MRNHPNCHHKWRYRDLNCSFSVTFAGLWQLELHATHDFRGSIMDLRRNWSHGAPSWDRTNIFPKLRGGHCPLNIYTSKSDSRSCGCCEVALSKFSARPQHRLKSGHPRDIRDGQHYGCITRLRRRRIGQFPTRVGNWNSTQTAMPPSWQFYPFPV